MSDTEQMQTSLQIHKQIRGTKAECKNIQQFKKRGPICMLRRSSLLRKQTELLPETRKTEKSQ